MKRLLSSPCIDQFTNACIAAMIELSTGPDADIPFGAPLSEDARARLIRDCASFAAIAGEDIADDPQRTGTDFWLTRNGHGSGFWDGSWPVDQSQRLSDLSCNFGRVDAYMGDDGLIYLS